MRKPRRDPFRLHYAPALAVGCFALAALSQLRVQVWGRDQIIRAGEDSDRFVVERTDRAKRGAILSADGKALAADAEGSELVIDFRRVPASSAFFTALGAASGVPASELAQLKAAGIKSRTWSAHLDPEQTRAVQTVKTEWRADGVSTARLGRRIYSLGEAAAGLIGHLSEGHPVGGLESAFDSALRGADGKTVGMVDRSGEFLPLRMDPSSRARTDGARITLTIDGELQLAASAALRQAVESNKAEQGSAIAIDPATGDILAMANWPSYDPERLGATLRAGERFSDFNGTYMARLEPGSTFKILTLAVALDEKAVEFGATINCQGSWQVWPTRAIRCDAHAGRRAHGVLDAVGAISKSCNVSAAHWAVATGYEPFTAFLKRSGLLEQPGLGLPGEVRGGYNEKEYAKRLQLATFGFGQSMTVTPLSLCSAFSSLGNGGIRMRPRLVAKVGDETIARSDGSRLISEETSAKVMRAMEAVFESEHGTGRSLRIPGYRLAGKTGTAEKRNEKTGTVGDGGYVSSFIGFVPAEKPRAAILVMVDNPKMGRYYGASVAGPVFHDIAKAVIRRYDLEKSAPARVAASSAKVPLAGPQIQIEARVPGAGRAMPGRQESPQP